MRNIFFNILLLVLVSCANSPERIADIQINDSLKRSDLVRHSLSEQREIIKSLQPEKQYELWKAKLEYVYSQKNLSKEESSIIRSMKENLSSDFFEQKDSVFLSELSNGILTLQEEYGWTEERIFINFMTIMTEEELSTLSKNNTNALLTYQRDYFQSQLEYAEYKIKVHTMGLIAVVVITILLLVIIYLVISRYVEKQQEEKDKLFEYAEEIRRQLNETEKNDSTLKSKYIALYRSRFETIGALTEKYLDSEGRTDIENLMFKKVVSLINEVKTDSLNRARFEAMLDKDLNMIMKRIRNEMPKLSELDYTIFSYLVIGFDATTISRLLDVSVNNIYAHKRRIRIRIQDYQPEHASQFLEMLA